MTNITTNATWGTGPVITFAFAYEHERAGATMRYKLKIDCAPLTGTKYFGYPIYLEISLDGKVLATHTLKAASPKQWSETISYTTGWLEVSKSSGTTALVIRVYSGSGSSRNVSYSYSLPVIATASTVSATDAYIGRTCSIIISRASTSLRHTLSYKFDGQGVFTTIVSKTSEAVYAWTVPTSVYSLIPDTPGILCTIRCNTYSGDTLIGSSECKMIASALPSACTPTLSATAVDTDAASLAVTGDGKIVVKGVSDLSVTIAAEAKQGARIVQTTVTCGSKSSFVSETSTLIENAESATVTVKVKDSRDFTTTYTVPGLSLVNYTPLWIVPEFTRPDPTGNSVKLTVTGGCYTGTIGGVANSVTLRLRTKPSGGEWSEWIDLPCTIADGAITAEATYGGFAYDADYTAEIEYSDLITAPTVKTVPIRRGIPVFWWDGSQFVFNVPIRGDFRVHEGMIVYKYFDVLATENIYLDSDGVIRLDASEIYLNGTKLSDILAKIGL